VPIPEQIARNGSEDVGPRCSLMTPLFDPPPAAPAALPDAKRRLVRKLVSNPG